MDFVILFFRIIQINLTKKAKKINKTIELVDKPGLIDAEIRQNPGKLMN